MNELFDSTAVTEKSQLESAQNMLKIELYLFVPPKVHWQHIRCFNNTACCLAFPQKLPTYDFDADVIISGRNFQRAEVSLGFSWYAP